MAREFDIPVFYRSRVISTVKHARRASDHRKKDLSPSILDLGAVRFKIARHFGFCFGVENAIEIAYRAVEENPTKRVFLLSEMIHNPHVNADLQQRGVRFILNTDGSQLVPFEDLRPDDIVIVPAFGTTVELFEKLEKLGINPRTYNATCPFVEKVWKRSSQLGEGGYTVIIHGKHSHEETRATFSHARLGAPSLIIRDIGEAQLLAQYLKGERSVAEFDRDFPGRRSADFSPEKSLGRIGVVNQTTMLATETQAISDLLRQAMRERYGEANLTDHFADTRDTLCYATSENQDATYALIQAGGDLAIVVGGYNSSNTSHLAELLEQKFPTYYVKDAEEILSAEKIQHLDLHSGAIVQTDNWLPQLSHPLDVLLTAGASCPDALVEQVLLRIASFFHAERELDVALKPFTAAAAAV